MWFEEHGQGEAFVLLHPGGADSRALGPLVAELVDDYRLLTPDQRGHGRTPDVEDPWSFEAMATDTIGLIENERTGPVHLLGYSDGAIVALHMALARPDVVRSLVFAAGVFHTGGWLPGVLGGEPPEFMADAYGEVSPDGREHWPVIVDKLARLHDAEPALTTTDLAGLRMPVLIIVGDDDEPRLEHLLEMYRSLPDGELAVIPRATHGFLIEKPGLLGHLIRDFHRPDKTNGLAPLRRT